MNKRGKGFSYGIIGAICWGSAGTFNKLLINMGIPTESVRIIGPIFLMLFFALVLLITNRRGFFVTKKMIPVMIIYGFFSALFNLSFVNSINYFPVGIVSTLQFCSVFILIFISYYIFKDPITSRKIIASILTVISVGMVLNIFNAETSWNIIGFIWILSVCFCWASMYACEKIMLNNKISGSTIIMFSGFFSVLLLSTMCSPWQLINDIIEVGNSTFGLSYLVILALGLIPYVGCYWFYVNSLKFTEASYTQMAFVMDPLTACILGFLVFDQRLQPIQIFGVIIILSLVIWLQITERQNTNASCH